jgi:hypothetical protein
LKIGLVGDRHAADGAGFQVFPDQLIGVAVVMRTTIRHWAQTGLLERFSCGYRHRWYYRVPAGVNIVKGYGAPHAKPPKIVPAPICHSNSISGAYGEIAFEIFERLRRHELQIVGPQLGGIVLREIRATRSGVYTDC